jgi:hypothetical protein
MAACHLRTRDFTLSESVLRASAPEGCAKTENGIAIQCPLRQQSRMT